jgi:hypothetical protein
VSDGNRFATDAEYLPELRRLIVDGRVRLDFDAKHLRGMDSPVAIEAETGRWALVMVVVVGLAFWWQGWQAGLAAGVVMAAIYLTLGRRRMADNLRKRIMEKALHDITTWRKLWRHGGVSLQRQTPGTATCQAPGDSWIRFTDDALKEPN